jgi:acyl transferase domain-containing protein
MGRGLAAAYPVFAAALEEACAALDPHLERPLRDLLVAAEDSPEASLLDRTEYTQPALFAIHVALYRLVLSFGIRPDYLLGHSVGEISAVHLAGGLALADAACLVAIRGRLMGELEGGGAMAAVRASEQEVAASLTDFEGRLCLAAVNAPESVVVSGDGEALTEWREALAERGLKSRELRVSHAFHSQRMEPMLAELEATAAELDFGSLQIPVISNRSGEALSAEQAASPSYWAEHAREAVRFGDGLAHLAAQGVNRFLELGPDPVLTAFAEEALSGEGTVLANALNRRRPEPQALLLGLSAMHCAGVGVDWSQVVGNAGGREVGLPGYPFQRRRYWLEPGGGGDVAGAGLTAAEHPLLGAITPLAGGEGWLFTARLSLDSHPWLGDHAVGEAPVVPASLLIELALAAAEAAAMETVEELTFEAPLVLPDRGAAQLQVLVGEEDEEGRRPIAIHSRSAEGEGEWVRHASGALGSAAAMPAPELGEWPPPGAEAIALDGFYEQVADLGLDYGPAFQGLRAAWRAGEELFAEVELAPEQAAEAEGFALHPALLDAALHSHLLREQGGETLVPFAFAGVACSAAGATAARVRLAPAGESGFSLTAVDAGGGPVLSIGQVALRPIAAARIEQPGSGSLLALRWRELDLPAAAEPPAVERVECRPDPELSPPAAAQALCAEVLQSLQEAIASEAEPRLAFITHSALAAGEGEKPDPAAAAAWGLVRSAQAEHPGRFWLIDSDGAEASAAALEAALAQDAEPQLALREGRALAPRLAPAPPGEAEPASPPQGTVLITGATGALGALFARHLAEAGAGRLLLVSRRGPEAPGAGELQAELEQLGAEVEILACDVSRREELAELLAERSPQMVLHCGEGRVAVSSGWGAWEATGRETSWMTPVSETEGLELIDRACAPGSPDLIAMKADPAALRTLARDGTLPPILSELVRAPARRARVTESLAHRLAGVPEADRAAAALEFVRKQVAVTLGHDSAEAVDPAAAFQDLGFDSVRALELRNRLADAVGRRLPASLVFDYPSSEALAGHLLSLVEELDPGPSVDRAIEAVRAAVEGLQGEEREQALGRVRSLAGGLDSDQDSMEEAVERIQTADAEELLAIVEEEIGGG